MIVCEKCQLDKICEIKERVKRTYHEAYWLLLFDNPHIKFTGKIECKKFKAKGRD